MAFPWHGSFLLPLGSLLACSGEQAFQAIDRSPEDVVVVAGVDDSGEVKSLEVYTGTDEPIRTTLGEGLELITFHLRANEDIVDVDPGSIAQMSAQRADAPPHGGCGRCLLGLNEPPLFAVQGSLCGLPDWVEGYRSSHLDSTAELRARGQISLSFPGDCRCQKEPPAPDLELTADLIADRGEEDWPFHVGALNAQDALGLFGRDQIRILTRDGNQTTVPSDFVGVPTFAAGVGSDFVVLARTPEYRGLELHWLAADGTRLERYELPGSRHTVQELSPGHIAVLGNGSRLPQPPASFLVCERSPSLNCAEIGEPGHADEDFVSVTMTDSGKVAALLSGLGFVVYERLPQVADVQRATRLGVELRDGTVIPSRWYNFDSRNEAKVGALGERLFFCGRTRSEDLIVSTMMAGLDPTLEPTVVGTFESGACLGFVVESQDVIALWTGWGTLRFAADGTLLEQVKSTSPEIVTPIRSLMAHPGTPTLRDEAGQFFEITPQGLTRRYGSKSWRSAATLASYRGAAWLFGANKRARIDGQTIVEMEGGFGFDPWWVTADGDSVLGIGDKLVRMDPDTGETSPVADVSGSFVGVVRPGTEYIVVKDFSARPSIVSPEGVRELPVNWDDPATTPEESEPRVGTYAPPLVDTGVGFVAAEPLDDKGSLVIISLPTKPLSKGQRVATADPPVRAIYPSCMDRAKLLQQNETGAAPFTLAEITSEGGTFHLGDPDRLSGGRMDELQRINLVPVSRQPTLIGTYHEGGILVHPHPLGNSLDVDGYQRNAVPIEGGAIIQTTGSALWWVHEP